ncbi:hypothetical protein J5N97_030036 [Dioscorea zingiberensis]|uniref:Alpha/beta hydrolase fold-3 domain-containing protein n=1 Tax=Dioscorea zingiberensis TaxID=325984 RepID=A0A9D5H3R6_9LILI|nr:hypothetical protein J5N97_030036 [Dioscorea zingiberensis]
MDPYKFLRISPNPDGSLNRSSLSFISPTTEEQPVDSSIQTVSKDLPLNKARNTWIRIFRPNLTPHAKHPIIIYFHGGGFILFSAASTFFHDSCANIAAKIPAVVLSVDYRLAPEHRLPAAYEDAVDAVLWLQSQARDPTDPWLASGLDFGRCFIMGSSSGGNIAYHAGLRVAGLTLEPLKIVGLILNQPYFGGVERTESEKSMADDKILPLPANDLMWELALPEGADRDHEYSNPARGHVMVGRLPKCSVRGYLGDPLVDRQREFVRMLEKGGVRVEVKLDLDGHHGIELFSKEKAEDFVTDLRDFVYGCLGRGPGGADPRL